MGLFYDIIKKQGHYEVYVNGQFHCSADDMGEAVEEIEVYLKGIDETTETEEKIEVYA